MKYFEHLYHYFNHDWLLAIAAYNAGEGTIKQAIKKNKQAHKPIDFWSLHLPQETKIYLYKLLALIAIIKNPDQYGIQIPHLNNAPYIKPIAINAQIHLIQIAHHLQMSIKDLYYLNAGLRRAIITPKTPKRILLPWSQAKNFQVALHTIRKNTPNVWVYHTIKKGDSLTQLAKTYHIPTSTLQKINHLSSTRLLIGRKLRIPNEQYNLKYKHFFKLHHIYENKMMGPQPIQHKIQHGESLTSIAKHYKVSPQNIQLWNHLKSTHTLPTGKTIIIWKRSLKKNSTKSSKIYIK